ncbi:shikimate dehydrogenase [Nocardioides sp. HDW12B]|uniref:shikimate dehydrogenase n=1 Tax=Nocardioides sp. HDW12B TaxID=2714939 RepID=UPI0019826209|nr:shikimate dehydrogenase [Nocardioides sp. HDW12B]
MVTRCAVLGSPIAHSLSPVLHRAAYVELGLDWSYDAVEVDEARLAAFVEGLDPTWRGLSLTMPLKRTVLPLLDEVSEQAALAQAANTVVLDAGRRVGHNTDIPGIVEAFLEVRPTELTTVTVLGGGATAASAALAAATLGFPYLVLAVRNPLRVAQTLAAVARHPTPPEVRVVRLEDLTDEPCDLLVSTIPATAQDRRVRACAEQAGVVFEALYDPWPTPVARAATGAGRPLVSGLDLLVHQAVLQVELMTGLPGPLATMRAAGQAALDARSTT